MTTAATRKATQGVVHGFGPFEFDEDHWELRSSGTAIAVPPKVMHTLAVLVRNPQRLVLTEDLFREVWPNVQVTEASLAKAIRLARQVLGDDGTSQRYIRTVRGKGYRFVAAVQVSNRPSRAPVSDGGTTDEPFVGRATELSALVSALERARAGKGGAVFVAGDVGIGKSRLVERFSDEARRLDTCVAIGRCCEEGGAPELWVWAQLVRQVAASTGVQPEQLRLLASVLEAPAEAPPDSASRSDASETLRSPSERFRFFDAVLEFFRRAAEAKPLVLLVEDLHAADVASVMLARFLSRELRDSAALLVCTSRPVAVDAVSASEKLVSKLAHEVFCIELAGLSPEETAHLLAGAGIVDTTFAARLRNLTDGNPLFCNEIVRRAKSESTSPSMLREIAIPSRIAEVIRGRFEALREDTRSALGAASVLGRGFDFRLLSLLLGTSHEALARALEPAAARRIVKERAIGQWQFTHALFRDVVYEGLGIAERSNLHLRAGEALEQGDWPELEPLAGRLAHHFLRAVPGENSEKAAFHAHSAGVSALRSLAFEEASGHFDHALEALRFQPNSQALKVDVLTALGHAERLKGDFSRAGEAFSRGVASAKRLGDLLRLTRAAIGFAQVNPEDGGENHAVIALLEEVTSALSSDPDAHTSELRGLRSIILSRLATCHSFTSNFPASEHHSGEALALAKGLGDKRTLLHALQARHWVLWRPGSARERLTIAHEMLALFESAPGDFPSELHIALIVDLLELGQRLPFEAAVAEYTRVAHAYRDSSALYNVRLIVTMRALLEGRFADAEREATEALPIGTRFRKESAEQFFGAAFYWLRLEQGRADECEPLYRMHVERNPTPMVRAGLLRLLVEREDRPGAEAMLAGLAQHGFTDIPNDWAFFATTAHLATGIAFVRDERAAEALSRRLAPFQGTQAYIGPAVIYLGPVTFYLALCEQAQRHHDAAVSLHESALLEATDLGSHPFVARIRYHLAEALSERAKRGDALRARGLAEEAEATSVRLGMATLAARASRLRQRLEFTTSRVS